MEEINDRFVDLTKVLIYTREKTALLTVGEKILIHQERAYLLNQNNVPELQTIRAYKVPEQIEKKIQNIINLIIKTRWTPSH
jgi:hypothetical protein